MTITTLLFAWSGGIRWVSASSHNVAAQILGYYPATLCPEQLQHGFFAVSNFLLLLLKKRFIITVIMNETISRIISSSVAELGITLPLNTEVALSAYYEFLHERNKVVNLTAITAPEDVARLHFIDSISLLGAISLDNERVIDVGSGAGFPGVVLKLVRPEIDLTLLDATGKKVTFLSDLTKHLGVESECIHCRAEEFSREKTRREAYDIVVSRAVAELRVLCELCLPFAKVGGLMVALKSVNSGDEITGANTAMTKLGAKLERVYDYKIPGTEITHRAVLIRKVSKTPNEYPRRYARIQNFPL